MRKKKLLQAARFGGGPVVKMQQPKADSPIAERMLKSDGPEMLSIMKTFQHGFGARLLWFKDGEGELGKRPGWDE